MNQDLTFFHRLELRELYRYFCLTVPSIHQQDEIRFVLLSFIKLGFLHFFYNLSYE
jgi:hypothetical protein